MVLWRCPLWLRAVSACWSCPHVIDSCFTNGGGFVPGGGVDCCSCEDSHPSLAISTTQPVTGFWHILVFSVFAVGRSLLSVFGLFLVTLLADVVHVRYAWQTLGHSQRVIFSVLCPRSAPFQA